MEMDYQTLQMKWIFHKNTADSSNIIFVNQFQVPYIFLWEMAFSCSLLYWQKMSVEFPTGTLALS